MWVKNFFKQNLNLKVFYFCTKKYMFSFTEDQISSPGFHVCIYITNMKTIALNKGKTLRSSLFWDVRQRSWVVG